MLLRYIASQTRTFTRCFFFFLCVLYFDCGRLPLFSGLSPRVPTYPRVRIARTVDNDRGGLSCSLCFTMYSSLVLASRTSLALSYCTYDLNFISITPEDSYFFCCRIGTPPHKSKNKTKQMPTWLVISGLDSPNAPSQQRGQGGNAMRGSRAWRFFFVLLALRRPRYRYDGTTS